MPVEIDVAAAGSATELADLAALTFPLACPPSVARDAIAAFVAANLSAECFADYLADPARVVLTATDGERIVGYAMLIREAGDDPDARSAGLGARAVWLGVNRNNVRAQAFYRKHGFEVTGTRRFRVGEAVEEDFVMTRPLDDGPAIHATR